MEFLIVLVSSLIGPAALILLKRKVDETNKQLTVNSYKSEPNTVLDVLHMIREDQKALRSEWKVTDEKLDRHIEWHLDKDHQ